MAEELLEALGLTPADADWVNPDGRESAAELAERARGWLADRERRMQ